MNESLLASATIAQTQTALLVIATFAVGVAACGFSAAMLAMIYRTSRKEAESWDFENARRIRLREACLAYRCFEPLIDELTSFRSLFQPPWRDRVRRDLAAGGDTLPWTAEEFLAAKLIEGCLFGAATAGFGVQFLSLKWTVLIAGASIPLYVWNALAVLRRAAKKRLQDIRRRLPFAVDLTALMMGAGAGFREGLAAVADESKDHPLGREFARVLGGLKRGQTLAEALGDMRTRLGEPDVNEFVSTVLRAEELGSPLGEVLLTMADQMRLRRSQWAEKLAGEAQAKITAPGMVIMVASMLVVIGPFILQVFHFWS